MSKPKVVIIGIADWAGSAYNACRAINSVGEFECRAISTFKHPFGYPHDVVLPLYPRLDGNRPRPAQLLVEGMKSAEYPSAAKMLEEADLIHLWNTNPLDMSFVCNALPINYSKVKVLTFTGTDYREAHVDINKMSSYLKMWKTTVQNPCLRFPDEIDSTFIPHAVDTDSLMPREDRENWVGTYRATHQHVPNVSEELAQVTEIVKKFPGWSVELDYSMPHSERMEKLAQCKVFVQDLSTHVGYWGRSSLEACALAVPVIQNWTQLAIDRSDGYLKDVPIVKSDQEHIEETLTRFIEDDIYRQALGEECREWVVDHYSYSIVGRMYSDLYQSIL